MSRFQHLAENKLSYSFHFRHACTMAFQLFGAAAKLVVHAFYPDWFVTDATDTMRNLLNLHELAIASASAGALSPSSAASSSSEDGRGTDAALGKGSAAAAAAADFSSFSSGSSSSVVS